jgi:hypothetical protein
MPLLQKEKPMKISEAIKLLKYYLKRSGDLEMGMCVSSFDGMNCEETSSVVEIGDFVVCNDQCLAEAWTDVDEGYFDVE